jgi:hypothetical protein
MRSVDKAGNNEKADSVFVNVGVVGGVCVMSEVLICQKVSEVSLREESHNRMTAIDCFKRTYDSLQSSHRHTKRLHIYTHMQSFLCKYLNYYISIYLGRLVLRELSLG